MLSHLLNDPVELVNPTAYLSSRLNQEVSEFFIEVAQSYLESFTHSGGMIQTTHAGVQLSSLG